MALIDEWQERMLLQEPVRRTELVHMVNSTPFCAFMRSVLEVKQGYYVQLAGVDLSTESGRVRAAQLQGSAAALDGLLSLVEDILEKDESNEH